MTEPTPAETLLGRVVVELTRMAAERWAKGDDLGAEAVAAGAWRLCADCEFVDRESHR